MNIPLMLGIARKFIPYKGLIDNIFFILSKDCGHINLNSLNIFFSEESFFFRAKSIDTPFFFW